MGLKICFTAPHPGRKGKDDCKPSGWGEGHHGGKPHEGGGSPWGESSHCESWARPRSHC